MFINTDKSQPLHNLLKSFSVVEHSAGKIHRKIGHQKDRVSRNGPKNKVPQPTFSSGFSKSDVNFYFFVNRV